jgi:hypothetical protein
MMKLNMSGGRELKCSSLMMRSRVCVDLIRGEEPQVCGAISGYRRRISTSVEVFQVGFCALKRCRLCLRGLGVMCWCEVEKRAGSHI